MSTALEKAAAFTPVQLAILSMLTGAGSFSGLRLMSDLHNKLSPDKIEDNKIKLQLPNPHKPQPAEGPLSGMTSASPDPGTANMAGISKAAEVGAMAAQPPAWWSPYAAVGLGLPAGFLGAKKIYDTYQGHQGDMQIEEAKKKYMHQLMLAQEMNKAASETPLVDSFCSAVAAEFTKTAFNPLVSAFEADPQMFGSKPPVSPIISTKDVVNQMGKDWQSRQDADGDVAAAGRHGIGKVMNLLTNGGAGVTANMWEGIAMGGAAGTLGLLINNHIKKKEREQKAQYPTGVEYAP